MFSNKLARLLPAGVLATVFSVLLFSSSAAMAMPAAPFPFTETQPDGQVITLRARGDENYNWVEDANGYTVVKNKGWFEYAVQGPSGHLNPNGMIVGRTNPQAAGLEKHIKASPGVRALGIKRVNGASVTSEGVTAEGVPPAGQVKNLVVLVRFSNHVGRTLPSVADVGVLFNANGGHPTLAPTGSIKDVYFENSYGQMTLNSDVNPGIGNWITVSNTEAYYAHGQSGDSTLWQALTEALTALDAVIDFRDYDTDHDGRIDSIAFIHSGYGAEWGGTDAYGTSYQSRIWSHRWAIQPQWNSNDGVSVFDYHISPGVWGTSGSAIGRIGVIAHETGHFFGLPDLYDTDGTAGEGAGSWELMANSWDFQGTQYCPPHFSTWSKTFLGWISPTVLSQPGLYTINQAETTAQAYRINTGFSSGEYLLIENRQDTGFDCTIPQGGVAIWHIDDNTGYNTQGYPGQGNWPANGAHYRVALLQADGLYDLEKGNDRGDSGDMHHAAGVDAIAPGPGNHPNTDTYKSGVVTQTGITISDISASGSAMTFCFNGCTSISAPTGLTATAQSTSQIALAWTDNSSDETGFTIERSANGSTWSFLASVAVNVTSYTNGGLSPNSTWFYRVRAVNGAAISAWSNTASATTFNQPPAAPTGLTATAASSSQINLNWVDNAGNETGYRVERSPDGASGWTTVATLAANTTSRSDSGLAASTPYYYRVAAFNSAGDSAFATANATTQAPPAFYDYVAQAQTATEGPVSGSYTNTHADDGVSQSITEVQLGGNPSKRRSSLAHRWTFNVTAGNGTTLTANAWKSAVSTDGDNFQFQWSTDGVNYTSAFVVSATANSNLQSAVLPNTLAGTVYVQVIDTNDVQGNSAVDTVNIDYLVIHVDNAVVTPPAAPTGLGATAVAYNQVNLGWTDNASDETAYEVQRAPSGGSYSVVATLGANASSYSDTGVSAQTAYDYKVRAVRGTTPSSFSNVASATTPAQPSGPINLSASGFKVKGFQQVDLTWSGAIGANVDIKRNGVVITTTANDGFYNDNINVKGTATYQYVVCNAGTAVCSSVVTVVF